MIDNNSLKIDKIQFIGGRKDHFEIYFYDTGFEKYKNISIEIDCELDRVIFKICDNPEDIFRVLFTDGIVFSYTFPNPEDKKILLGLFFYCIETLYSFSLPCIVDVFSYTKDKNFTFGAFTLKCNCIYFKEMEISFYQFFGVRDKSYRFEDYKHCKSSEDIDFISMFLER